LDADLRHGIVRANAGFHWSAAPFANNPWDKLITASKRPWPAEAVLIEPNGS
jgi:hypothetical protein